MVEYDYLINYALLFDRLSGDLINVPLIFLSQCLWDQTTGFYMFGVNHGIVFSAEMLVLKW